MSYSYAIRPITHANIPAIVTAFAAHHWHKPALLFEGYMQEKRGLWVAYKDGQVAGYVSLQWQSDYPPFQEAGIPEIKDLNVLPPFRKQGIASALLDRAEQEAAKKSAVVGIAVGLYSDYGAAQRLYIKRGYLPDGRGITTGTTALAPGSQVRLDDDLVLWMVKLCSNSCFFAQGIQLFL